MKNSKLKLPKQWEIYNVFYKLLLEQDKSRRKRVDKKYQTWTLTPTIRRNIKSKLFGIAPFTPVGQKVI